jgi:hypothetical protein
VCFGLDSLPPVDAILGAVADNFPYIEHRAQTTPEGIRPDVAAAVQHLRSLGVRSERHA